MKQRASCRPTTPKTTFQACIRAGFLKQSYESKPYSFGRQKALRRTFKKFYKEQRKKDREIGLEINKLFAEFFDERKYLAQSGKPADEETIKFLGELAERIKNLKESQRFRNDFPSFASFYRFAKKQGVTLQEITEE